MSTITVNEQVIALDKDGYLKNLDAWNHAVAEALAEQDGLNLTDEHWQILHLLQEFYREFELSPAMRPLIKYVGVKLGSDKGKSIYLMKLFGQSSGQSPALIASRLAGLPRPTNCM